MMFLVIFSSLSYCGKEERLQNDLFCVQWDVKPQLNQSVPSVLWHYSVGDRKDILPAPVVQIGSVLGDLARPGLIAEMKALIVYKVCV